MADFRGITSTGTAASGRPAPPPDREQYRTLIPERIVATAEQLERRIGERFPDSSLRAVADELCVVARQAVATANGFRQPIYWLRLVVWLLVAMLAVVFVTFGIILSGALPKDLSWFGDTQNAEEFIQTLEAMLGSVVFVGAAVIYLLTLERRWKRERLLAAMRELRALAHIVDMHQLTKDPETVTRGEATPSSPKRTLTTFQLSRYLDYCSELLSLINKIGAVYVQEFPDPEALEAVDQLANLTNGLSRTIWQKIMILDRAIEPARKPSAAAEPRASSQIAAAEPAPSPP